MSRVNTKTSPKITPLWIIAAFVTLTETILGYALTKVSGGVQVTLTCFVIIFALLVAGAFFAILWNRPYVFYPPSEYGSVDPAKFIGAMSSALPKRASEQLQLVAEVEKHPADEDARFALVDSLIDDTYRQHLILMHEFKKSIPCSDSGHNYEFEIARQSAGQGTFDIHEFFRGLEGTGFIEMSAKDRIVSLTSSGHRFAEWLTTQKKKATYFRTPFGGWGEPRPGGIIARMPMVT